MVHKDQKVPLEPCRKMSRLSRKEREKHFFTNCVGGKFFENFSWVFRGVLIKTLRLSYHLSNLVVWEPQKFSIIQKITRKIILKNFKVLEYKYKRKLQFEF